MVARRLREHGLYARTVQLKLRYKDFSTITRSHSLSRPTQLDGDILQIVLMLFRKNWKRGAAVRLLGVQTSSLDRVEPEPDLLGGRETQKWQRLLTAADSLRDKYGEGVVSLGSAAAVKLRERTHENPANLPGKTSRRANDESG
jgi:DNA polymerase-4